MLDNIRRKSVSYSYNNHKQSLYFEGGLVRYKSNRVVDVCNQKLSKNSAKATFKKAINRISSVTRVFILLDNMIYCPSGDFVMGFKGIRIRTMGPQYNPKKTKIEQPFLLGETEVTQGLYQAVMGTNPSKFQNDSQNPVENVTWYDAIKFCNKFSVLQGFEKCYTISDESTKNRLGEEYGYTRSAKVVWNKAANGYRLPTEKEWEYAAKAGTQNEYAGTDNKDDLGEYAWFGETWYNGSTRPVKTKKPNEWGFYDMAGNVWEWCWDNYEYRDPAFRVTRGGSWDNTNVADLSSAERKKREPYTHGGTLGFRICRNNA